MRFFINVALMILILGIGCGCSNLSYKNQIDSTRIVCYEIADSLDLQLRLNNLKKINIVKTKFINIDSIADTDDAGRIYSEFISSKLSQKGCKIIDLKIDETNITMEPYFDEIILSYDPTMLEKHDIKAALVGYYKRVNGFDIALIARIIDIKTNQILAAKDFSN